MAINSIEIWVNERPEHKTFREVVHTILYAISSTKDLQGLMVMKGGILLALGYESTRFTTDIDFSSEKQLKEFNVEEFVAKLDPALVEAVENLGYDVDCLVQSWEQKPPREDATFPTLRIKVGYANRSNERMHRRLLQKNANHVVRVDFSLNEPRGDPELFEIEDGKSIQTYSYHDLVAEKYRAVLQQEVRNRKRRQDIYDLRLLIDLPSLSSDNVIKSKIIKSLKEKSEARNLSVDKNSMKNPEIVRRSREQYDVLANEIEGDLPDFEESYELVRIYYESLPWG